MPLTRPIDMRQLAAQCDQAGRSFSAVGADFERAARLLDAKRLEQAEGVLRRALESLEAALDNLPGVEDTNAR